MPEAATILLEDAPQFEFRGGLFYVTHPCGAVRAMRPATFFAAIAAAVETSRAYRIGGAEVVPIHAASA